VRGVAPAGYVRRFVALCVDWFACLLIVSVFFSPVVPFTPNLVFGSPDLSLIILGLFVVETWLLVWLLGGSFGQKLIGLSVVSINGDGRVSFWRALIRSALVALVLPPLIVDGQGRGLQDRAASTEVLRKLR
jgi:hypothetical protein